MPTLFGKALVVLGKVLEHASSPASNSLAYSLTSPPTDIWRRQKRGICPKCGGRGYIPRYQHVSGGVCFVCKGSGVK
jgi:hypothetical protein